MRIAMQYFWLQNKEGNVIYSTWLAKGMYPNTTPEFENGGISKQRHSRDWSVDMQRSELVQRRLNMYLLKVVFKRPFNSGDGRPYDLKFNQSTKVMTVVKMYDKYHYSHYDPITTWNIESASSASSLVMTTVTAGLVFNMLY